MAIVRSLGPCYMFQWVTAIDDDSGEASQLFAPVDSNGLFPTYKDWHELVKKVSCFYDYLTPAAIEAANERQRERSVQGQMRQSPSPPVRHPYKGYVYLLSAGLYYKIGCTQDVDRRITQIQPKLPFVVHLVCSIPTDDMYELESILHEQFAYSRTNGEWFMLDEADVEYMKGLAR